MIDSDSGFEAKFTLERERGGIIDEPPFRMLVLGDWSGDGAKTPLADRRPIEIDRDNFDDVMARLGVSLNLTPTEGESINLDFSSLDDFHPDQIFDRLALFERLRGLRSRLLSSDGFNSAAREVRSWFSVDEPTSDEPSVSSVAETNSDGLLDAILSGSTAPAPKATASGEVASLIKDLVRPHLVSVDESEQAALLAAIDAATSDLMRSILANKRFKALEASWRGLYLLVRRCETNTDLKIYVLDVTKDELAEDLRSVSDLSRSFFHRVMIDETSTAGAEPWAVVAGDYAFSANKDDIAALMRVGKVCAASDAPFISHIRPEVLGVPSLYENSDALTWDLSTNTDAGKLWAVLRSAPESGYLGMTMPRFLSRLPYGRESDPLEKFQFEEFDGPPEHDQYVWSNTCFIAGLLLAQTFSAYGWDIHQRYLQDIEQLPMHVYKVDGETIFQPCAEVLLTQNACEQMMEHGLMPLVSYKNTDHVKLARFQSITEPVTALRGRWSR